MHLGIYFCGSIWADQEEYVHSVLQCRKRKEGKRASLLPVLHVPLFYVFGEEKKKKDTHTYICTRQFIEQSRLINISVRVFHLDLLKLVGMVFLVFIPFCLI